ncbi:MAG: hypothetical protein KIS87_02000 [Phycisphaeraceae bacterium]|nr:hypothetical protein [Phycisphaeraceae bacterium]
MDRGEAFRTQAASDLAVFGVLLSMDEVPACHCLHYLQMATEKLGRELRTSAEQHGAEVRSHVAIVKALRLLRNRREAADALFDGDFDAWRVYVDRVLPLVAAIERLAPAVAGNGENPEYPWEATPGV